MPWKGITGAVIAVVVCLIASRIIVDFMVDWIWFSALGYWDVFWTVFRTRTSMFLVILVTTAALLSLNGWLASGLPLKGGAQRSLKVMTGAAQHAAVPDLREVVRGRLPLLIPGVATVVGALVAAGEMTNSDVPLQFISSTSSTSRDVLRWSV